METLLNKTIAEIWKDNYIVPLYQRNFAWKELQINQLLQDIYDNSKENNSNYYVGSLVVIERQDGTFEVIDGQQRLTVLSIICKAVGILQQGHLRYDSREEVIGFFDGIFKSNDLGKYADDCGGNKNIQNLVDAVKIVLNTKIIVNPDTNETISIAQMGDRDRGEFAEYIKDKVILVRTILPAETDVAAYFEIMNNRGEQLQEHEIVKALMMGNIKDEAKRAIFAKVWDACSQMNVPIQSLFTEKKLFGDNYDSLDLKQLDTFSSNLNGVNKSEGKSISEILDPKNDIVNKENVENNVEDPEDKYEAIVDFPNFLMHVLKITIEKPNKTIPLNSDNLLKTYKTEEVGIDSWTFIAQLFKCRVLFDRYVVRNAGDEDEGVKWEMKKPYKDDEGLRFKNTFAKEEGDDKDKKEGDDDDERPSLQKRIIKQQSMLQVTYRNKKYKNWLFDLLNELMKEENVEISGEKIKKFLDQRISYYYENLEGRDDYNAGVRTPHFLLNFIDYLYWVASTEGKDFKNKDYVKKVFDFKYYNSVEHHFPHSYDIEKEKDNKDNIGNLFLTSVSSNSRMSNKSPEQKAVNKDGLSPKRSIMYAITNKRKAWGKDEIEEHGKDVTEGLLPRYKEILDIHS